MSKYHPLSDHLARHADDEWRASFSEIEAILGTSLPKAAQQAAWWRSEAEKPHQRTWLDHDWKVEAVNAGLVTFRRDRIAHEIQPPALKAAAESASNSAQAKRAAGLTAAIGGAVALVAGLGVLAFKAIKGRKV